MSGQLYVGAMTGTSVDGLDLCVLRIHADDVEIVGAATHDIPASLQSQIVALIGGDADAEIELMGRTDRALGDFIGTSINSFLASAGIPAEAITAIGSHGQTIRHRPNEAHAFTLQIGDPNAIAEGTGIQTVADFRRRDVAAGGQGAPLVPPFHAALFGHTSDVRVVANIGGIANITVLEPGQPVRGHDTGPGNALLDAWCQQNTQQRFDENGRMAASGAVQEPWLRQLLADPYLAEAPPKSTGKEHYNLTWLRDQMDGLQASPEDVQRTLTAFTAACIAKDLPQTTQALIVCGGGRSNPVLMQELADRVGCPVATTEQYGFDGDAIESAAFAWLAHQTLTGQPGNAASVTGARGERVLGAVFPA